MTPGVEQAQGLAAAVEGRAYAAPHVLRLDTRETALAFGPQSD